jgi:hypothetical protein
MEEVTLALYKHGKKNGTMPINFVVNLHCSFSTNRLDGNYLEQNFELIEILMDCTSRQRGYSYHRLRDLLGSRNRKLGSLLFKLFLD